MSSLPLVVRAAHATHGLRRFSRSFCSSSTLQSTVTPDEFGQLARSIASIRAETPSIARTVHLNAAGASPTPAPVLDAHIAHLTLEAEIGGYAAAEGAAEAMNNVYASLATYLSAEQHEVALVDSSTTAFAKALYST
eukprot:gene13162-33303_t